MRKAWIIASLILSAFVFHSAIPALAQEDEIIEVSFEDDLISGDLVRPDGENIQVSRRGARSSLIRIRQNFIPEMLKSVEDL